MEKEKEKITKENPQKLTKKEVKNKQKKEKRIDQMENQFAQRKTTSTNVKCETSQDNTFSKKTGSDDTLENSQNSYESDEKGINPSKYNKIEDQDGSPNANYEGDNISLKSNDDLSSKGQSNNNEKQSYTKPLSQIMRQIIPNLLITPNDLDNNASDNEMNDDEDNSSFNNNQYHQLTNDKMSEAINNSIIYNLQLGKQLNQQIQQSFKLIFARAEDTEKQVNEEFSFQILNKQKLKGQRIDLQDLLIEEKSLQEQIKNLNKKLSTLQSSKYQALEINYDLREQTIQPNIDIATLKNEAQVLTYLLRICRQDISDLNQEALQIKQQQQQQQYEQQKLINKKQYKQQQLINKKQQEQQTLINKQQKQSIQTQIEDNKYLKTKDEIIDKEHETIYQAVNLIYDKIRDRNNDDGQYIDIYAVIHQQSEIISKFINHFKKNIDNQIYQNNNNSQQYHKEFNTRISQYLYNKCKIDPNTQEIHSIKEIKENGKNDFSKILVGDTKDILNGYSEIFKLFYPQQN